MTSQDMSQDGRTPPDPEYVALYRRLRAEGGIELREQLHDRYLQLQRGGVTPGGLPWPAPVDPVAEGADAIRALAEAIDPKLGLRAVAGITPLTGWALYLNHTGGVGGGSPFVGISNGLAVIHLTAQNNTGAAFNPLGGANIATGLPPTATGVHFALTIYGPPPGIHPGPPRTDLAGFVNATGGLGMRGSGSIAAGGLVDIVGVYPAGAINTAVIEVFESHVDVDEEEGSDV